MFSCSRTLRTPMCAKPRANPPPSARPNVGRGAVAKTFGVELRLNSREKARTERTMRSRLFEALPRKRRPMPIPGQTVSNTVTRSHDAATSPSRGVTFPAHSVNFRLLTELYLAPILVRRKEYSRATFPGMMLACTCTKCSRHANLRRHSYLRSAMSSYMNATTTAPEKTFRSYVPENTTMPKFTLRAVLLGLIMTVILGAANAYLGLRAGMTIAATYPAAVIGMAVLRVVKGSILEENIARTAGSIGESVAAGAVFTIPAFIISRSWLDFSPGTAYWKSTSLMLVGSVLGVLFVSLVRRAMVEDPQLPFPESVAASQIHKAGQLGAQAAKYLFYNMAFAATVFLAGFFNLFATDKDWLFPVGTMGTSSLRLGPIGTTNTVPTGGVTVYSGPTISPAYVGVGYVIGPVLASLNFSGTIIAWGLLIPLLMYFMGPQLHAFMPPNAGDDSWIGMANTVWRYIVRPIAVGGMLFGAAYTLFRMRKSLGVGLA